MHYNALHCITLHCVTLHHIALHDYKILAHMHTYMHDHTCIHTDTHMYICLHIIYIWYVYIYIYSIWLGMGVSPVQLFLCGPASGKKNRVFCLVFIVHPSRTCFGFLICCWKFSFIVIYLLKIVIFHSYVGHGFLFIDDNLLGGLEHGWIMTFHSVGNAIIPTDEHIFQRDR